MAAKRKSIKDKAKASASKLSNKRIHRLGKQGKLKKEKQRKKNLLKKYSSKNEKKSSGEGIQTSLPSIDDPLDPDDIEFFREKSNDFSFTSSIKKSLTTGEDSGARKRKRKTEDEDENEAQYEHSPRKVLGDGRNKQSVKHLLPIKTRDKLIPQTLALETNTDTTETVAEVNGDVESIITRPPSPPPPPLTCEELFLQRRDKLIERKQTIASLANSVIHYPEKNLKKLKELRLMLYEEDPDVFITVRKLTMVSLLELFKDVIPGYRIRPQADDKQVKLKQETQSLVDYETGLLNNYRLYLEFLEDTAKGGKGLSNKGLNHKMRKRHLTHLRVSESVSKAMSEIAIRCLCEMLVTHPHFNYRNNIIAVLVPIMCKKSPQTLDMICEAVKTVFGTDKSGDISLEIVRLISRVLKSRNFKVQPKVLDTFLALKIKNVYKGEEEAIKKLKHKEKMLKYSRRERKRNKELENLEKELLETKATVNQKGKLKLHAEVIQTVFLTYFRILKTERKSPLLSAVLEGLARFSHLINIEFFGDLFEVFNKLIDSQTLTYRETLHCVLTAFTILTGQGSALNIDPIRFYKHLYKVLFKVHTGQTSEDVSIVLNCLHVVFNKRKRLISEQRILAYIKRLCSVCLQLQPHGILAVLAACRTLVQTYSRSDMLYDNEVQGSGVYLPELDDPEHCHAHNTALWELTLLRKHYHPKVRRYGDHMTKQAPITGDGQLPVDLSRKSPIDVLEEFNLGPMKFDENLPEKIKRNKKEMRLKGWLQSDFQKETDQVLQATEDFQP